mmetsp:Transcript_71393/g.155533  ORF Transcript_71393/g.155533 Transcript_71393/m.155533 type:complete len:251 (+) Transcript_71393:168-920(+)
MLSQRSLSCNPPLKRLCRNDPRTFECFLILPRSAPEEAICSFELKGGLELLLQQNANLFMQPCASTSSTLTPSHNDQQIRSKFAIKAATCGLFHSVVQYRVYGNNRDIGGMPMKINGPMVASTPRRNHAFGLHVPISINRSVELPSTMKKIDKHGPAPAVQGHTILAQVLKETKSFDPFRLRRQRCQETSIGRQRGAMRGFSQQVQEIEGHRPLMPAPTCVDGGIEGDDGRSDLASVKFIEQCQRLLPLP